MLAKLLLQYSNEGYYLNSRVDSGVLKAARERALGGWVWMGTVTYV
jgi:hypothetical protein